jgi:hypothetical protein
MVQGVARSGMDLYAVPHLVLTGSLMPVYWGEGALTECAPGFCLLWVQ